MTTKQKQWQLYFLGYYNGSIDGQWGRKSKVATMAFQDDNDLRQDGLFGPATEAKTMEIVRTIQQAVTGYAENGLTIDGLAGSKTKAATAAYQKAVGLAADGIAGPQTRAKINGAAETGSSSGTGNWWDEIKYFDRDEFKCKCGGKYCNGYPAEMQEKVVRVADRARSHFGAPATVISGLRCPIHNKNEGGVSGSRHKTGRAIDLRVDGVTAAQLLAYMKQQPEIRYTYKINGTNVHFDIL